MDSTNPSTSRFKLIPFDTFSFAKRDLAYANRDTQLVNTLPFAPSLSGIKDKIANRSQFPFFRKEVTTHIKNQMSAFNSISEVNINIKKLENKNTFSITTAHQPSLFLGPLYLVYKALSAIKLSNQLTKEFPELDFVPIFVVGAEDHDFAEINHLHIFNKKITWQEEVSGPVGLHANNGPTNLLPLIKDILGELPHAPKTMSLLTECFSQYHTYGEATQALLHRLFGPYGLICIQLHTPAFKKLAIPIFRKEIIEQPSAEPIIKTIQQLKKIGFKPQAKPRNINLFYMKKGLRTRIIFENNLYRALDTPMTWTPSNIEEELNRHPERFSPNVILRPIYQELLLPNIAYVGGGGELAYWMERPQQFDVFGVSFPVLIRRDSAFWISAYQQKQLQKLKLNFEDLLLPQKDIIEKLSDLSLGIAHTTHLINQQLEDIESKLDTIDISLRKKLHASRKQWAKELKSIDKQANQILSTKARQKWNKVEKLQAQFFPDGGLQERYDNFLAHYATYGKAYFDQLLACFDPLKMEVKVVESPG